MRQTEQTENESRESAGHKAAQAACPAVKTAGALAPARGAHAFLPPALPAAAKAALPADTDEISGSLAPPLPAAVLAEIFAQSAAPAGRKQAGRAAAQTPAERRDLLRGTLVARDLVKKYRGRSVVNGVSFGVRAGEAVGILGPNGAGKTTCFYMVTGLVPADSGIIEIDGFDVTGMPMYRRARLGVGYLPQEASIFRGLSVEDNIKAVLEVVEKDKKRRQADLDALLEEFKIAHLRRSMAISLSGGERRRLEIARALASRPNFMLLDEPFAGIDPIAIADIQQLVRHLTRRGIGVLITDHNVRETLGLVDRAYIINAGKVLTHGRPDEIVANADVRRLYLGDSFSL